MLETPDHFGIVLEYAEGGELFEYILAHQYLKESEGRRCFAQLISGVYYLHSQNIFHRDLKLENLLLDKQKNVLITDFGFATIMTPGRDRLLETSCGSPCYAAPELVIPSHSKGYLGESADIWSCGVILYAMLSGYLPWDDDPENPEGDNVDRLYEYIIETDLTFEDHISKDARALIRWLLTPNPKLRASSTLAIMDHQWLKPFRWIMEEVIDLVVKTTTNLSVCSNNIYFQAENKQKELSQHQRQSTPPPHSPAPEEEQPMGASPDNAPSIITMKPDTPTLTSSKIADLAVPTNKPRLDVMIEEEEEEMEIDDDVKPIHHEEIILFESDKSLQLEEPVLLGEDGMIESKNEDLMITSMEEESKEQVIKAEEAEMEISKSSLSIQQQKEVIATKPSEKLQSTVTENIAINDVAHVKEREEIVQNIPTSRPSISQEQRPVVLSTGKRKYGDEKVRASMNIVDDKRPIAKRNKQKNMSK